MNGGPLTTREAVPEWARQKVAEAYRILLNTLEEALLRRAKLDAQIARIETALRLDDPSVLYEGDVGEVPDECLT